MPGIFISYRRSDSPDATGRLYDRLVAEFGKAQVFKDVDSIPLGQDFRGHLNQILGDCAAVLAIVGPYWSDARNEAGQRRLEDPEDFLRIELEAALARNIPVVPVLVGLAPMPAVGQLPTSLAPLAFRQSIEVRPDPDFHNDATRLVAALRRILDPSAAEVDVAAHTVARARDTAQPLPPPRRLSWTVAAAAVAGMIAFAVPALRHLRETPPAPPPETRLDIVTPATDQATSFALSPDGRQIVFEASAEGVSRLWIRSLASTAAQPLAGTEGALYPFWSPDSRSIAFFATGTLKRLDLGGGAPLTLAPASSGLGGAWSADGVIVFAPGTAGPLMRVGASGGAPVTVSKLGPQHQSHRYPQFLPDGRRFLYFVLGSSDIEGIYLSALDGSGAKRLVAADSPGLYLPSGWLLWVRAGSLVAQRLDLTQAALTGEVVTLAEGVAVDNWNRSALSVAATGQVAYRAGGGERQLSWFDRMGTSQGTVGDPDRTYSNPRVSPDGHRVVVTRVAQGNTDLWLLEGARTTRFTFDAAIDDNAIWSPDGARIVFRSSRTGGADLYQKPAAGTGAEQRLSGPTQLTTPFSWSPDGRFLLYLVFDPLSSTDIWIRPMTGDPSPSPFLKTPFRESAPTFSPDGQWVAYQSNESGRAEIYVRPFVAPGTPGKAPGGQWQVSTAGGTYPVWAAGGKELYYLNPAGDMVAAPISVSGPILHPGAPMKLFATHIARGGGDQGQGRQYDVARDGRFLINTELDRTVAPITLIQNWNPQAKPQ